jgi:hypothetical protein
MSIDEDVKFLNKCYTKISSWKDIFKIINDYLKDSFHEYVRERFCKHKFEVKHDVVCRLVDEKGIPHTTYTANLIKCPRCGKRDVVGEVLKLDKSQQDGIRLWLKKQY